MNIVEISSQGYLVLSILEWIMHIYMCQRKKKNNIGLYFTWVALSLYIIRCKHKEWNILGEYFWKRFVEEMNGWGKICGNYPAPFIIYLLIMEMVDLMAEIEEYFSWQPVWHISSPRSILLMLIFSRRNYLSVGSSFQLANFTLNYENLFNDIRMYVYFVHRCYPPLNSLLPPFPPPFPPYLHPSSLLIRLVKKRR